MNLSTYSEAGNVGIDKIARIVGVAIAKKFPYHAARPGAKACVVVLAPVGFDFSEVRGNDLGHIPFRRNGNGQAVLVAGVVSVSYTTS